MGQKNLSSKKCLGTKMEVQKMQGQTNFVSKKFRVQRIQGKKNGQKNFDQKSQSRKTFKPKKILSKRKFGTTKFQAKKMFGPK